MTVVRSPASRTGWTAGMIGKFLPAKGYQMGDLYYFKGPWKWVCSPFGKS